MSALDRSAAIGFSLNSLDRLSETRHDEAFVRGQRGDPSTRFLVFVDLSPVLNVRGEGFDPLFAPERLAELGQSDSELFLGRDPAGAALFAVTFGKEHAERMSACDGLELVDLRSIALRGLIEPALLGALGGANAMFNWHRRHRFCANCGAPSKISAAGWRRDCGTQHFPRVDPVVIMLAIDGDRCLLGRQSRFGTGMYSALAGFLEPGETIEDAVRREIHEESGISCSHVTYFASQPWPFPSSLMIGCFATALNTDIVVDKTELEDARWFTREEVAEMLRGTHASQLSTPKPYAIAYHLLKAFVAGEHRGAPDVLPA
jgi:NAD+ diphosphatase